MKQFILTSFLTLIFASSYTQSDKSVGVFAGPIFSSFSFVNSSGEDQSENYESSELKVLGVQFSIEKSKHTFRPGLQMRQGGAKATMGTTPMTWKLNYLDVEAAYLFRLLKNDFVSLKLGAGVYGGYLLGGEQTIGTKSYSLNEEEVFSSTDFGATGIANTQFSITRSMNLFVEYQYGMGLSQIENDVTEQETKNKFQALKVGLSFNLK